MCVSIKSLPAIISVMLSFAAATLTAKAATITDLGTLGGSYSQAYGLNANGEVVGISPTAGNAYHAFSYAGGSMTDLGTLGGSFSSATGVNASGQIVGISYTAGDVENAYSYQGGSMTALGTLGGTSSAATGINAAGMAPHDMPNNSRPKINSRALWTSEMMKKGAVFPSNRPARETGAIRNRHSVPISRSLMNERAMMLTRKNANITV